MILAKDSLRRRQGRARRRRRDRTAVRRQRPGGLYFREYTKRPRAAEVPAPAAVPPEAPDVEKDSRPTSALAWMLVGAVIALAVVVIAAPGHERVVLKVANSGSFIFPEVVEAGELISVRLRELAGGEVKVWFSRGALLNLARSSPETSRGSLKRR